MSRRVRAVPLAVLAGAVTFLAGGFVLGALALSWAVFGPRVPLSGLVSIGVAADTLAAVAVAALAERLGAALRGLRDDAVSRLEEPHGPVRRGLPRAMAASAELSDLARTLDALHLRVRVADEVAARHRRSAETASVGMFELLAGLVEAEEAARGQLAAELHDTVAQSLMVSRRALQDGTADGASLGQVVERAVGLVAEAEDQVRAVMARTRPPALRDGDLGAAVAALRDDLHQRYALVVAVDWPTIPVQLPLALAVTVYRFLQEGLLNVVKHADTDVAEAGLAVEDGILVATVIDAGPGFLPAQVVPTQGRHVGLELLRERARLAGGALEVASQPGAGTTLRLRLPLQRSGGGLASRGRPAGSRR